MNDAYLERLKKNIMIDQEALPLMVELHDTYGEEFLYEHLYAYDNLHTLAMVEEIKREMEDKFIISVCANNHITEKELKLDLLFHNCHYLISYDEMIEILIKNKWIARDRIYRNLGVSEYRALVRTIYSKGMNFEECPSHVKGHFILLKHENNNYQ